MSEAGRGSVFDHEDEPGLPPAAPQAPFEREVPPEPEVPSQPEAPAGRETSADPETPVELVEQDPVEAVDAPAAAETPEAPEHAAGGLRVPAGIRTFGASPNGARRSVAIAVSRFNGEITSKLLQGALAELEAAGVVPEAIDVMPVPGAFELPLAAMALAKSRRYSCVLALGCVIRGETPHFDYVAAEAASGVQLAGLETGVPVSFGVLTCDTNEQAEERAGGTRGNKGAEAARSALEMVESLSQLRSTLAS